MSRKSAERRLDATADDYQRELVKLIRSFSHGHHLYTVFSDFVELSAIAISNSVDRAQFDAREKRYMDIVGKYTREEIERFPQMLGLLTMSFELRVQSMRKTGDGMALASGGLTDVLGQLYMMLELGNDRAGQFFTPYPISRLMASLSMADGGPALKEYGFVRLQEPACGAGGMVIAAAEALNDAGHNYQQVLHATCIDIDPCCVHMAYLQLSLLHIPATVVHGNALSLEVWGVWSTPAHVLGGWRWKLRRRDQERREIEAVTDAIAIVEPAEPASESAAVCEVDDSDVVTVVERPAIQTEPARVAALPVSLMDLFEESATSSGASIMFEKIDQLTLF